jgi:hypothetical protein
MAQVAEHLPIKHGTLSTIKKNQKMVPSKERKRINVHAFLTFLGHS